MRIQWKLSLALLLAIGTAACGKEQRPALVVVISIDQFRADYLERFKDLFLPARNFSGPGGFRYFMEQGKYYRSAHHEHFPLYTAPGHAALLTGAFPYKSGIVSNDWFDRVLKRRRYCVEDCSAKLIDIPDQSCDPKSPNFRPAASAKSLRVSTLGDQLKLATGGHAKVWGIALKDRAGILMAGHAADGVIWFHEPAGTWTSSTAYFRDGSLPGWLKEWNQKKIPDTYFGRKWDLSVPPEALERLIKSQFIYANSKERLGTRFPHTITAGLTEPDRNFYTAFTISPFGNEYVFQTADEIISREQLGKDDYPDLLTISLSSNDHAGHQYGPDSPEVLDITVRTDRLISDFLRKLDSSIGLSRVVVVVSADHGVSSNSRLLREHGFPAGNYDEAEICRASHAALSRALGPGEWIYGEAPGNSRYSPLFSGCVDEFIYLNHELLARRGVSAEKAQTIVQGAIENLPGVYAAYSRSQIISGRMPATDISRRIQQSYHPLIGADVLYVTEDFWTTADYTLGATHGAAYIHDTAVPVLAAGGGLAAGEYTERVSVLGLAPSLSLLLGVLPPSGADASPLPGFPDP